MFHFIETCSAAEVTSTCPHNVILLFSLSINTHKMADFISTCTISKAAKLHATIKP